MKILYGITKSNFGGAQRYVLDLAGAAIDKGHEAAVILGGNGILKDKLIARKVPVLSIPNLGKTISPLSDARAFLSITSALERTQPDVFHVNSSKMGGMGAFAARIAGTKKIIFTCHGWASNSPRPKWQIPLLKLFSWLIVMLSHRTICVSEKIKSDMKHWPFVKKKLVVIKNGTEPFDIYPRAEARDKLSLGIPKSKMLVGTLSELHPVKGLDVLLEAWKEFVEDRSATLVILGEGEERERLERQAENLGIRDSVIFAGYVDNARSLLGGLDIYVSASRSECLPYSLIEAGYAGAAVVATRVGGVPEIVEDKKSGLLIESEDPLGLVAALERLSDDKDLRKELGTNLRQHVRKSFSHKVMLRDTLDLYGESR